MLSFKTLVITLALIFMLGSVAVGVFSDLAYLIGCGFCPEGQQQFKESLTAIVTAGQSDVKLGVEGMLKLKNDTTITDPTIKAGLVNTYKSKIITGSLLTLIYIFIFFVVISKLGDWVVGFPPPTLLAILISIFLVGIIHWSFSGFTQFPYQGWTEMAMHPEIWSHEFIDYAAPVPTNYTPYV